MIEGQTSRPGVSLSLAVNRGVLPGFLALRAADLWLAITFLLLAFPVLRALWIGAWSTAQGAQGPIVVASGLWLLARAPLPSSLEPPSAPLKVAAGYAFLALLLAGYALMLVTGFAAFAWASLIALTAVLVYLLAGWQAIASRWFPLCYLLFAAPVPTRLAASFVNALSTWLSSASVEILWFAGIDASHSGLDLYIDQYELRMADACAGLNSLTSLFAVGMFYVYVRHRGHWAYAIALCLLVPPIAVLANLARILALLLITHFWGDGMAQGLLHTGAGMFMFIVALVVLLGLDAGFARLGLPKWLAR